MPRAKLRSLVHLSHLFGRSIWTLLLLFCGQCAAFKQKDGLGFGYRWDRRFNFLAAPVCVGQEVPRRFALDQHMLAGHLLH